MLRGFFHLRLEPPSIDAFDAGLFRSTGLHHQNQ